MMLSDQQFGFFQTQTEIKLPSHFVIASKFVSSQAKANYVAILDTNEPILSNKLLDKPGALTQLFQAIAQIETSATLEFGIIYCYPQDHSLFIGIHKTNNGLNIFLIEPTGLHNKKTFIEPLIEKLKTALINSKQIATIYINTH